MLQITLFKQSTFNKLRYFCIFQSMMKVLFIYLKQKKRDKEKKSRIKLWAKFKGRIIHFWGKTFLFYMIYPYFTVDFFNTFYAILVSIPVNSNFQTFLTRKKNH